MELTFYLYYDAKGQRYLVFSEVKAGKVSQLWSIYWGSGDGAVALPLDQLRSTVLVEWLLFPRQLNLDIDAMESEHVWKEPETGTEIVLRQVDPANYAIHGNGTTATITPK